MRRQEGKRSRVRTASNEIDTPEILSEERSYENYSAWNYTSKRLKSESSAIATSATIFRIYCMFLPATYRDAVLFIAHMYAFHDY